MERFVDLFMKMDDLHLLDLREMRHVKRGLRHCIFCSNGRWLGCLFAEINSFQARGLAVLILRQKNHKSVT